MTLHWIYFKIQTDNLITARRPDLELINKKKRICHQVDLTITADHRQKIEESEKKDKYLDFARELKYQLDIKVTLMPIIISALGTVRKGLEKRLEELEIRGRIELIQTTALLTPT